MIKKKRLNFAFAENHYKMKYLLTLILAGVPFFNSSKAQEIHGNPNVWLFNLTEIKINDQWQFGNEFHFRYDEYVKTSQQFLFRPYIDYGFSDKLVGSFGYTYILTKPYGDYPLPTDKPEHNIWEQITVKNTLGEWNLAHRFRLENRWSGNIVTNTTTGENEIDGYNFSNRFRYRLTLKRNIGTSFYTHIFDELWIREKNKVKSIAFDRNWIYAGLGWKMTPIFSVELAYLHQYVQNNPDLFERHHSIQGTLKIELNK